MPSMGSMRYRIQRHNSLFALLIGSILSGFLFQTHSKNHPAENLVSQPKAVYEWPVLGVRAVTGTFGEYRNTHFHMGMDFSTGGRKGLPIVSVSKGKIVAVERYWNSIGNAVIVENEDGIYARYGHLSKFAPRIINEIKKSPAAKVYRSRRDFEYKFEIPIEVERGEVIAYSGDTGIGPPHLHLELFRNGIYYNPKDFGLGSDLGEEICFNFITFHPGSSRAFINGKHEPLTVQVVKDDSGYRLNSNEKIHIQGLVSIQLSGYQKSGNNRLGLQTISMEINQQKILHVNFYEIPRSQTNKFVLMYDAYKSKINGDPFLYNLYSSEGNGIAGLGKTMVGSGLISSYNLNTSTENSVVITATGIGDNIGELYFSLVRDESDYSHIVTKTPSYNVKKDKFTGLRSSDKMVELFFPAHSVFIPAYFEIQKIETPPTFQAEGMILESGIYRILPENFREFNLGYDLYLKINPTTDLTKCSLYEISSSGKIIPVPGASFSSWGRFLKVRMKRTGTFAVFKDTIPPEISLVEGYENGHVFTNSDFEVVWQLSDKGSGFDQNSLLVKVDGKPGLAEINPHNNQALIVEPEFHLDPGEHIMEVTAFDKAGNRSETKVFRYIVEGQRVARTP